MATSTAGTSSPPSQDRGRTGAAWSWTVAAPVIGDSLGTFAGPVGTQIWQQTCGTSGAGTLVGPTGVTWREASGTPRGLVLGGIDLVTQVRRGCTWGF